MFNYLEIFINKNPKLGCSCDKCDNLATIDFIYSVSHEDDNNLLCDSCFLSLVKGKMRL